MKTILKTFAVMIGIVLFIALMESFPRVFPGLFILSAIAYAFVVTMWPNKAKAPKPPEEPWVAPPAPRADCMPPGCNDYPECNHRY